MSRNTGSVASSDTSWLKLYAAVAVLPLALAACGGGGGGGGSPTPAPAPAPTPTPAPAPTPTTAGTTWNTVAVTGAGNLVGIDYADNHFVAVSDTGMAITSTDGATWTSVTPLTSNVTTDHLKAYTVGHLGTTIVAAGAISSTPYTTSLGAVASSTDGATWTMGTLPTSATPIHGMIAGPHLIALGEGGHLYSSTNGTTWSAITVSGGVGTLNAGAYGNGHYVGIGDNGYVVESGDGAAWAAGQVIAIGGVGVNMHGIAWTGSQFVAVGDSAAISTSTDGAHWTALATSAITGALRSVAVSSSGTIVVVGDNGIETSSDGITWVARNASGVAVLDGVAFGNGSFVAVGTSSTVKASSN